MFDNIGKKRRGLHASDKKAGYRDAGVRKTVTFGTYAGEPIEWRVMTEKEDGTCVLLSEKGLDAKPYNTINTDVTWERCSLRAWLNGEFYENAFSADEKKKIVLNILENRDNEEYGTEGGNITKDYVFLLSLEEEYIYFDICLYGEIEAGVSLACMPTQTAKQNGAGAEDEDFCRWWLRSPGYEQYAAATVSIVDGLGTTDFLGEDVCHSCVCVRPAVRVKL